MPPSKSCQIAGQAGAAHEAEGVEGNRVQPSGENRKSAGPKLFQRDQGAAVAGQCGQVGEREPVRGRQQPILARRRFLRDRVASLDARGAGFQKAGDRGHVLGVDAAVEKLPGRRPAADLDRRAPRRRPLDANSDDLAEASRRPRGPADDLVRLIAVAIERGALRQGQKRGAAIRQRRRRIGGKDQKLLVAGGDGTGPDAQLPGPTPHGQAAEQIDTDNQTPKRRHGSRYGEGEGNGKRRDRHALNQRRRIEQARCDQHAGQCSETQLQQCPAEDAGPRSGHGDVLGLEVRHLPGP